MVELEKANTIAKETVEQLASRFSEPEWLLEKRLSAWESYYRTAMPSRRDEGWRQSDLSELDFSVLRTAAVAPASKKKLAELESCKRSLPTWLQDALGHFENLSGVLFQSASKACQCFLDEELSAQGIIFCDMATAVAEHADKLKEYLGSPELAVEEGKFALLTKALFNCGVFLYVPRGLAVEKPFIYALEPAPQGQALLPCNLVVADESSQLTLAYLLCDSDESEKNDQLAVPGISLLSQHSQIQVRSNAFLRFLEVQKQGRQVFAVNRSNSSILRDGRYESLTLALGSYQTKTDMSTSLLAPGASSRVLGVVLGAEQEKFSFNTIQEHAAPDTTSDINFRVALKDKANSVYQGIVKVAKLAQRTDAYQSNKNLLLDAGARADSNPKLEILADDVKCSHGATVGPVDPEQIFYLMSRGISRSVAEQLVVLGFFRQTLELFPLKEGINWLSSAVSAKIRGGRSESSTSEFFVEVEQDAL